MFSQFYENKKSQSMKVNIQTREIRKQGAFQFILVSFSLTKKGNGRVGKVYKKLIKQTVLKYIL